MLLLWLWLTWIKETICIPGHWKTRRSRLQQKRIPVVVLLLLFPPCSGKQFFQIFQILFPLNRFPTSRLIASEANERKWGLNQRNSFTGVCWEHNQLSTHTHPESELQLPGSLLLLTHVDASSSFFALFFETRIHYLVKLLLFRASFDDVCIWASAQSASSLSIFSHASFPLLIFGLTSASSSSLFSFVIHLSDTLLL